MADTPATPTAPDTNWKLAALTDTRENLIEAIGAAAFVPPAMKAALVGAIQATHGAARFIKLDVHCHVGKQNGKTMQSGHWCITEI